MINGYPSEDELRTRISNQISWRGPTDTVALLWHGYLSALLEWGLIEVQMYDRVSAELPKVGSKELHEIFLDEPIGLEQEQAIDGFLSSEP